MECYVSVRIQMQLEQDDEILPATAPEHTSVPHYVLVCMFLKQPILLMFHSLTTLCSLFQEDGDANPAENSPRKEKTMKITDDR
jgi:hypothetical protein